MKSPEASIIITCYNLVSYLEKALASAFTTRDCDFEVILVDDGSTDKQTIDTLEKISTQKYEHPFTMIKQQNMGLPAARNAGIKKALGEYILPLDADNMIRPDYLPKAIKILQNNAEIGIVYGNAEYFGAQTGPWIFKDLDVHELMLENKIDACAVFRKKVWQDSGGYDEVLFRIGYEDWDFWLSAYEHGWKFYWINEILFDYCVRADSMVQKCALPENYTKLIASLRKKHANLYKKYWPNEFFVLQNHVSRLEKELTELHEKYGNVIANLEEQTATLHEKYEEVIFEKDAQIIALRDDLDNKDGQLNDLRSQADQLQENLKETKILLTNAQPYFWLKQQKQQRWLVKLIDYLIKLACK